MPELPDLTLYVEALERSVAGRTLASIRLASPFVLRTVAPSPDALTGRRVVEIGRIGKRIVLALDGDFFIAIHLMIAGRLRWTEAGKKIPRRLGLASFDFENGSLLLTEAGSKRRAAIHLFASRDDLAALDRRGVEPLTVDAASFAAVITSRNHTLKRALTDPSLFSGIGNAYSDEILHAARLSPLRLTQSLSPDEIERLHDAVQSTLRDWIERLRGEFAGRFPEKVTAFREGMAVHGRYDEPCPDCGSPVQRIVYAENETNYCATCQTDGRLLRDRALSRLLRDDWPRSIDDL